MVFFSRLLRRLYLSISELSWSALTTVAAIHVAISYILLAFAGEVDLRGRAITFLYYYVVTATTLGYGDLAPRTDLGRLAVVLFVLPGGIAIFTAVLGKVLTEIGTIWRNRMRGFGDYTERRGHIIVVGWQEGTTLQTLRLVGAERPPHEPVTVLIAKDLTQNPAPECADYVRVDRLADADALTRAGAAGARTIIIRGANDDETLAAVLVAEDHAPGAHIVAYFADDRTAQMVRQRRPRVEAVGSLAEELLSRSARDPGASEVAARLLSASSSDTAFSLPVPSLTAPLRYGDAFVGLKRKHNVTLVGMASQGLTDLNCRDDVLLKGGETLYYIGESRLEPASVVWPTAGATP
ncbi:potassium channel protein [Brucella endophytica]|uniref:Potassium channel protein n=1 Tax=Brucella endophytica TaxID=1963359 RepID=A0A916SGT9_9HYPH|nr:ion channel [Brucella endophytica]GGA99334.1 potassium channel protein [Brucella endophytica]